LKNFLKEKLPDYMIPFAFVVLNSLPLTPNGKVDRKALPVPELGRADMGEPFIAPRTPVEEMLAGIWGDVLGLKEIGIHDNFFELGGHSLLATQVMSRMRKAFQVELSLRSLFEMPTIAGLAIRIAQSQAEITDPEELAGILNELEGTDSDPVSELGEIEDMRHE
jgi:acyl carrier protein